MSAAARRAESDRFPHGTIALLGLITIAAYGTWYYAFGILLDPILSDTGWAEWAVSGIFSAAAATGAVGAVAAGRLIDRVGSRPGFVLAAVLGAGGLTLASYASTLAVFAIGAIVGGASLQALGFYHVTQTTAARSAPGQTAKAISLLTIYGAFSSTIYLPLTAFLVTTTTWRTTLRALVGGTAVILLVGAALVREGDRTAAKAARAELDFRAALRAPGARRFIAGSALVGLAVGTVLVYQVPLMTAAGLPVGVAAWMGGARGAAQITGRIPLPLLLRRLGARAAVRLAFSMIAIGLVVLPFAGNVFVALVYVAIAGFGIGATSPLQGIYASELFADGHLGASMGVITMAFGLSTAAGPAIAGLLSEITGSRWWSISIAVICAAGAVAIMGPPASNETKEPAVDGSGPGPAVSGT